MPSLKNLAQPGDRKLPHIKLFYARTMWAARHLLEYVGIFAKLTGSRSHSVVYLASLFAIYDIEEMNRQDLAWWTFGAIRKIDKFLAERPSARVFEYGSGASTLWLARRAMRVVTVEEDWDWYEKVRNLSPSNVEVYYRPPDCCFNSIYASRRKDLRNKSFQGYVETLCETNQKFDVIVIDGRCRSKCIELAECYLNPGGVIVLDDIDMHRYCNILPNTDMKRLILRGWTPCLPYQSETTIFFSR